jgi:hypothetical protein
MISCCNCIIYVTTANVITHFLSLRQGEYPEGGERVDKTGKAGMGLYLYSNPFIFSTT